MSTDVDQWYKGKVVERNEDGTFDIQYEDGDLERRVPRVNLRDPVVTASVANKPTPDAAPAVKTTRDVATKETTPVAANMSGKPAGTSSNASVGTGQQRPQSGGKVIPPTATKPNQQQQQQQKQASETATSGTKVEQSKPPTTPAPTPQQQQQQQQQQQKERQQQRQQQQQQPASKTKSQSSVPAVVPALSAATSAETTSANTTTPTVGSSSDVPKSNGSVKGGTDPEQGWVIAVLPPSTSSNDDEEAPNPNVVNLEMSRVAGGERMSIHFNFDVKQETATTVTSELCQQFDISVEDVDDIAMQLVQVKQDHVRAAAAAAASGASCEAPKQPQQPQRAIPLQKSIQSQEQREKNLQVLAKAKLGDVVNHASTANLDRLIAEEEERCRRIEQSYKAQISAVMAKRDALLSRQNAAASGGAGGVKDAKTKQSQFMLVSNASAGAAELGRRFNQQTASMQSHARRRKEEQDGIRHLMEKLESKVFEKESTSGATSSSNTFIKAGDGGNSAKRPSIPNTQQSVGGMNVQLSSNAPGILHAHSSGALAGGGGGMHQPWQPTPTGSLPGQLIRRGSFGDDQSSTGHNSVSGVVGRIGPHSGLTQSQAVSLGLSHGNAMIAQQQQQQQQHKVSMMQQQQQHHQHQQQQQINMQQRHQQGQHQ
jgi:hypothetical protein